MIKSITFDIARTLVYIQDYRTYWRELSDFLVNKGIELYPQELEATRDYVFMVDLARYGIDNWYDWSKQIMIRLDYPDVSDGIINGITDILIQSVQNYKLYDDVIPVFEQLAEFDLSLSCLTTIPEFKLKSVLEPIRGKLKHIVHGGNAKCAKGNPKMYNLDLKWKEVTAEENLFIGDDHLYDIELPSKMGMTTINIERDSFRQKENTYSNYQVSDLTGILPIVEKLV